MGNVEVEIYISKFKKFFDQYPDQLTLLIGNFNPDVFYDGVKDLVKENLEKDKPLEPTRKQILDLLVKINTNKSVTEIKKIVKPFIDHHMGGICLN